MRTNEERIALMHQRHDLLKKERAIRTMQFYAGAAAFACVMILAVLISRFTGDDVGHEFFFGMNASMFSQLKELGYIIIAIISFVCGISVTIFCFYLKRSAEGDK